MMNSCRYLGCDLMLFRSKGLNPNSIVTVVEHKLSQKKGDGGMT